MGLYQNSVTPARFGTVQVIEIPSKHISLYQVPYTYIMAMQDENVMGGVFAGLGRLQYLA